MSDITTMSPQQQKQPNASINGRSLICGAIPSLAHSINVCNYGILYHTEQWYELAETVHGKYSAHFDGT